MADTKVGSDAPSDLKVGSANVLKIYVGSTVVWERS